MTYFMPNWPCKYGNLTYILGIPLNQSIICIKSSTSIGYFSNSTDLYVTSGWSLAPASMRRLRTQAPNSVKGASSMNEVPKGIPTVFKIEVFNALQTRFGPSKYTSFKISPSKRNLKLKMKTSLEVLNIMCPPQEPTCAWHCHCKK